MPLPSTGPRAVQREATRLRILAAAVDLLVESGYAATSTLAVQSRAAVSRGALLHHFPTRGALFGALAEHLVASNEQAVVRVLGELSLLARDRSVRRALQVLFEVQRRCEFQAELELWAAARTDGELRQVLRSVEGRARPALHRLVADVFGPQAAAASGFPVAAELSVTLMRGLVVALPLRDGTAGSEALLDQWADLLERLLPLQREAPPIRPT